MVIAGIDLGGTFIKGALFDEFGRILVKDRIPTEVKEGKEKVMENIIVLVDKLSKEFGRPSGIGIGVPGIVTPASGVLVKSPNFPGWEDFPILDELSKRFYLPIIVENDANCAAMGEKWAGAGKELENYLMLTLGTGIGGGLVLNNRIWQGVAGRAGEVGHVNVVIGGRKCGCGSYGCLEAYSSGWGIVQSAFEQVSLLKSGILWEKYLKNELIKEKLTPRAVYMAALEGDKICKEIYTNAGYLAGAVIGGIVNLLDIHDFIIGGGVSEAFDLLISPLKKGIKEHIFGIDPERILIHPAMTGNDAGVIGAGYLILKKCL